MDLLQWCFGQQRYIIFEASPSHTQLFPCLDFGVRNKRERERGGWTCVWEGKSSERHPSGRESGWKKRERCLQVRMGCKETQGWRPYQKPLEWCLTSQSKVFSLFFWVYCIMFLCGVFVHLNDFFFSLFFVPFSSLVLGFRYHVSRHNNSVAGSQGLQGHCWYLCWSLQGHGHLCRGWYPLSFTPISFLFF